MIKVYNKIDDFFKIENVLIDVDRFFDISIPPGEIDKMGKVVMQRIDNAVFLDQNIGTIKTPYGVTSYKNLSTGCKCILDYLYLTKHSSEYQDVKAIDFTESGWNAIDCLLDVIDGEGDDLGIVIRHDDGLYKCKSHRMLFNNEKVIESLAEFYI